MVDHHLTVVHHGSTTVNHRPTIGYHGTFIISPWLIFHNHGILGRYHDEPMVYHYTIVVYTGFTMVNHVVTIRYHGKFFSLGSGN